MNCCIVLRTNDWVVEVTRKNQVVLTRSLLKWPKCCFVGLIVFVWRSVADAYCKIPFGDYPSDLDPETFDTASTITVDEFCTFRVLLNIEHDSPSSSSLPVFMQ